MTWARTRTAQTVVLMVAAIVVSALVAYAADWAFYTYQNWHQIQLARCDTPVVRSFARDEFRAGDPVASLTDRYEPTGSVRHGDCTTYFYTSDADGELWVIACDGKLVSAQLGGYAIRGFTFFETRTYAEAQECSRSRDRVLQERLALFAVVGFAGANHRGPVEPSPRRRTGVRLATISRTSLRRNGRSETRESFARRVGGFRDERRMTPNAVRGNGLSRSLPR